MRRALDSEDRQTYRGRGARTTLLLAIIFIGGIAGICVGLAFVPNVKSNAAGIMAWVVMIGGALLMIVLSLVVVRVADRNRYRRIGDYLQTQGFAFSSDLQPEQADAIKTGLLPQLMLPTNGTVGYYASKLVTDLPALAFEFTWFTGTDDSLLEHIFTLVSYPTKQGSAVIWVSDRRTFHEQASQYGNVRAVGDEAFDRRYIVDGPDRPEGDTSLSPTLREFIAVGPQRESWAFVGGMAWCMFAKAVDADGITAMVRRAKRASELIQNG